MATNSYLKKDYTPQYHNHNDIISLIKSVLEDIQTQYPAGGIWSVVQSNQPTIQTLQNEFIYFDVISKRRIGVQGNREIQSTDGQWTNVATWYEEWLVQVGAFKQRNPDIDNSATFTAIDKIEILQAALNGSPNRPFAWNTSAISISQSRNMEGNWFVQPWAQLIRSTELRVLDFETDSGLKEKLPQFDFLLVIEQELKRPTPSITDIALDTTPV